MYLICEICKDEVKNLIGSLGIIYRPLGQFWIVEVEVKKHLHFWEICGILLSGHSIKRKTVADL